MGTSHIWKAALLTMAGALVSGEASANELAERDSINQDVVALMRVGNFSELEARAASYRTSRARTSSGLWKLTLYYYASDALFNPPREGDVYWSEAERFMKAWLLAYPDSPTPHLLYARLLLNHGLSYRGEGPAASVRPEDWAPFKNYVQQARRYLEDHKAGASVDPYWYELMAIIGYLQGWPEPQFAKLVAEGLDREPAFYQIYFAAVEYYSPRWHGNALKVDRFAREAVRRTKAFEGSGMYARIYWNVWDKECGNCLSETLSDWTTMKKGIDDVLKTYPDAWNVNNFARFACLAQDKAKTAELVGRIKDAPILQAWKNDPALLERCRSWSMDTAPAGA